MTSAETLRNTNALGLSLHTRIVLLIMAISLVSIVFISAISIESSQQQLRRDVGQRLNVIASDRMEAIENVWDLRLQHAEALAAMDALVKEEGSLRAYYGRALAHYGLKQKAPALADIDQAIRRSPEAAHLRQWRDRIQALP